MFYFFLKAKSIQSVITTALKLKSYIVYAVGHSLFEVVKQQRVRVGNGKTRNSITREQHNSHLPSPPASFLVEFVDIQSKCICIMQSPSSFYSYCSAALKLETMDAHFYLLLLWSSRSFIKEKQQSISLQNLTPLCIQIVYIILMLHSLLLFQYN